MMAEPKYCPNCGKEFSLTDEMGRLSKAKYYKDQYDVTTGYDCYCALCGWSGNIEPDDENQRDEIGMDSFVNWSDLSITFITFSLVDLQRMSDGRCIHTDTENETSRTT